MSGVQEAEGASLGEALIAIATARARRIEEAEIFRKFARDKIDAKIRDLPEFKGLDEDVYFRSWKAEVINSAQSFEAIDDNPGRSYLLWIDRQLEEPFRPNAISFRRIATRHGDEFAWEFASIVWRQEIAWMHRLRRSSNELYVLYADLFRRTVLSDHNKCFENVAARYAEICGELSYRESPDRPLTVEQIAFLERDPDGEPLFMLVAKGLDPVRGKRLEDLPSPVLQALAGEIRETAHRELRDRQSKRINKATERFKLAHVPASLYAAVDAGFNSDELVACEKMFLGAISEGEVRVPLGVSFPHLEFGAFIRKATRKSVRAASESSLLRDAPEWPVAQAQVVNWIGWRSRLPDDFSNLEAMAAAADADASSRWYADFRKRPQDRRPLDPIVDYGMYLIRVATNRQNS